MTHSTGINLLPPEAKVRIKRRHFNLSLIKIGILMLAIQGAGLLVLLAWRATAVEAETLLQNQVTTLRINLKSFDDLRQQASLITDRSTAYQTIKPTIIDWGTVIDQLGASTPSDTKLRSFSVSRATEGIKVTLSGDAASRASVIAFRQTLEATPSFTKVEFETSQLTDPETNRVNFTLTAELEKPGVTQ